MTKAQKTFYKIMHVVSIIAIIGVLLGGVLLAAVWIWQPAGENVTYGLELGALSLDFSEEMIIQEFFFSHLFFITVIVVLLVYFLLFVNIKKFFKNLIHHHLFVHSNANAIRNVGWILIVMGFVNPIPAVIAVSDMLQHVDFTNAAYTINYEVQMGVLFAGLAILAVGQIFKYAVKIAEENELTI